MPPTSPPARPDPSHAPETARHGGRGLRALLALAAGPALFLAVMALPAPMGLSPGGWTVAAVAGWMALWWLTQAVPLPATALLPAILFPLLGVTDMKATTSAYGHPLVFLFLGGFVIALTMERWNLHRRIAIRIIAVAGTQPARLTAGFMAATALLSMWVSNTATTLMMVPIALSVIAFVDGDDAEDGDTPAPAKDRFARGLLLSIAYAASIGGTATLIGTPPNAFLAGYMGQNHGIEIGFAQWMALGLPVALVLLIAAWLLLTKVTCRADDLAQGPIQDGIARAHGELGPIGRGEALTALLFLAVALTWMFRPLIDDVVPLNDTAIALIGAVAAFAIPVDLKTRSFLMDWSHAARLPWGILILFGGGLSLAGAIQETGLAHWLGGLFAEGGALPLIAVLLLITGMVVFLTEITSNTATAAVFIPVAAALAATLGFEPMVFAVPVALAASCAFMMPGATPPNAIVFAAGRLDVAHMCAAGVFLNFAATAVIALAALYLVPRLF